jgi:hypothetical protein
MSLTQTQQSIRLAKRIKDIADEYMTYLRHHDDVRGAIVDISYQIEGSVDEEHEPRCRETLRKDAMDGFDTPLNHRSSKTLIQTIERQAENLKALADDLRLLESEFKNLRD